MCAHTRVRAHLWEHHQRQKEVLIEKREARSWQASSQAQFLSHYLEPHHPASSSTRFPLPPFLSFFSACPPPYSLHRERLRPERWGSSVQEQRHQGPKYGRNDSDSHLFHVENNIKAASVIVWPQYCEHSAHKYTYSAEMH